MIEKLRSKLYTGQPTLETPKISDPELENSLNDETKFSSPQKLYNKTLTANGNISMHDSLIRNGLGGDISTATIQVDRSHQFAMINRGPRQL